MLQKRTHSPEECILVKIRFVFLYLTNWGRTMEKDIFHHWPPDTIRRTNEVC